MPIQAAQAQQTVNPGRIDERLRPADKAPDARSVDVPELPRQQTVPDSAIQVRLTQVRFDGATAVPIDALNAIAAPYLNRDMPLAEVFKLAEEVTAEYRRRGFVLSRAVVGPQRIENGVLTLQVIEGHVGATRIEGNAGGYAPYLNGYLSDVAAERPTSGATLTRALLLARDLQGVDVRAVLTPSPSELGAADLALVVDRKPIEGFVAVDNRGSRWLGPLQVYGGLSFNDTLGIGERISITAVSAPADKELGFLSATWDQPLTHSGLRMTVFGSYAATHPGDELRLLDLRGRSATYGLAFRYPFVRSRETNLFGRLVFTGRDSSSRNIVIDPIFDDTTRTVQAELFGNYAAPWGGVLNVRASVTQGMDILGATKRIDLNKSRATATGQGTRVNAEVSFAYGVAGGLYFQASGAMQYSGDSLLASEEFGIGGEQYGRAYDPSEITGDKGVAGRAEFFYAASSKLGTVQPYGFYEAGRVAQNKPLPGEPINASIESAGFGVRFSMPQGINGSLEYAKPLTRPVASRGDKDGRVFFSLGMSF
ncbi:ShlB/FhaC/HecB family hemolysin secretion/activation protein [Sphingomonas sp. HITSZ_GF]|uniref:ShlB/FhaC/HecB family hemolysin secretion/activation protein n=1 Tax=Sphingomonas sp. HITSZ_GF TaxID=3037247 RepID=UPI00240D9869|nr:ShlB/FhaC/HecB family hemolysin secretion/activation protein [Sphingomonas sp. HITSZ_GF]MDG2535997.1 ShlB/FhaC/HecB family hemolysin secretion/activation protein [Sphingomonas sp. HITSZ_GF]